ncbi:hypothetical protein P5V15_000982 [Pogonomyrmex californicus]
MNYVTPVNYRIKVPRAVTKNKAHIPNGQTMLCNIHCVSRMFYVDRCARWQSMCEQIVRASLCEADLGVEHTRGVTFAFPSLTLPSTPLRTPLPYSSYALRAPRDNWME